MLYGVRRFFRMHMWLAVLFTYITFCLIFGGASRDGYFAHGILQATAAIGIALIVLAWPNSATSNGVKTPVGLIGVLLSWGLIHIIPIPFDVWRQMPGRNAVLDGYQSLGVSPIALPMSMDPESSLHSLSYALTPLFVLVLSARVGLRRLQRTVPIFLTCVGGVTVLLGLLQVIDGRESALYLYQNTNRGYPVGLFANVNHFAILSLIIVPFVVLALQRLSLSKNGADHKVALGAVFSSILLLLLLGIGAAGSIAVYIISIPVFCLAFSWAQMFLVKSSARNLTAIGLVLLVAFVVFVIATSPILAGLGMINSSEDPTSRQNMWSFTLAAATEYWPIGTGAGTYESVIPSFENPNIVSSRYIASAHNEYLQLVMEYGVAGVVVILLALVWLGKRTWSIMRKSALSNSQQFQKAALLGVYICMIHCLVDYSVRTPTMAAILSLLVASIALSEQHPSEQKEIKETQNPKRLVL